MLQIEETRLVITRCLANANHRHVRSQRKFQESDKVRQRFLLLVWPLIAQHLINSRAAEQVQDSALFWVTRPKNQNRLKNKGQASGTVKEEPLKLFHSPVILMDKLSRLIYSTVQEKVTGTRNLSKYNPKKAVILCQALAGEIKKRIKLLEMRNYRVVAMVSVVPKQEQGISYKMALHGDHLVDFFANSKYETHTFFILGTVYMVFKH